MATGPLTELLCLSKHFVQLAFLLSHALKQVPRSTLSFSRKLRIPTKSLLQQFLELPRPVYSLCVVVSSNVLSSNKHIGDHTLSSLSIQLVLDCVPIRNLIQLNHDTVDVPHVPEKSLGLSAVGTKRFTKDATFWRQPLRLFRVPTGLNLRRGQTRSDGDSPLPAAPSSSSSSPPRRPYAPIGSVGSHHKGSVAVRINVGSGHVHRTNAIESAVAVFFVV